jgi:ATP-binding cassette, subfamily B, bacterial
VDSALGLVQSTTTLVGMVGALAVVAPAVAALLVVAALPALAAEILLSRRRAEMAWRISPAERRELFYTDLLTDLRAAKEVRLFGLRGLFRHRMLQELATSNREQRRFDRREAVTQLLLAALSAVLAGGCIVWALLAAARGALTLGDVAAVLLAVGSVQATLTAAVNHVSLGHHAALLLDHYRAVVGATATGRGPAPGTAPDPADRSPAVPVSGADHAAAPGSGGPADHVPAAVARGNGSSGNGSARGIEFDDVWFRYADDLPWALRGVSLSIPTGRALAVVGENGSGKSTLVKLLCRFYDPVRGGVRWDGTDLRDIPLDELHGRIAAVFQDFMDYELTAGENIALGDAAGRTELDVDADRVAGAARRAQVHEALAALPQGYRTLLSREFSAAGEDGPPGVLLSGGQWQRVALARALLRGDRSLLVLDEPSSGLDAEAEFRIHQEMRRYREGRTSVLVSHRLNTVRDADRIVVLAAGRVAEEGDHDALVAAGGQYARLFELQAAGYETSPA